MFECCQCRDNLCLLIIEEYSIFPWGVLSSTTIFGFYQGDWWRVTTRHQGAILSLPASLSYFQYSVAVAARTRDDSLGRLSQRVAVKVKPEDVPLNLRGEGVTTHTMRLTWGPPIR